MRTIVSKKLCLLFFAILILRNLVIGAPRIPDHNFYSLQNVVDVVTWYAATTNQINSLADCFMYALPQYYDPRYNNDAYAPPSSLARFRNYGSKSSVIVEAGNEEYYGWTGNDTYLIVELVGAGGGGGRSSVSDGSGGGGGGGGAYIRARMLFKIGYTYLLKSGKRGIGAGNPDGFNPPKNGGSSRIVWNNDSIYADGGKAGSDWFIDEALGGAGGAGGGVVGTNLQGYIYISNRGGNGYQATLNQYGGGGGGRAGCSVNSPGYDASRAGGGMEQCGNGVGGNAGNSSEPGGGDLNAPGHNGGNFGGGGGGSLGPGTGQFPLYGGGMGGYGQVVIYL